MEGMHREERGHKSAPPFRAGHPPEDNEEQKGIGGMEDKAYEMMPICPQPKQLHVQHVRKPRQRVPIGCLVGLEGPTHIPPGQSSPNVKVSCYVRRIVKVDEAVVKHRPEAGQSYCSQKAGSQNCALRLPGPIHQPRQGPLDRLSGSSFFADYWVAVDLRRARWGDRPCPCTSPRARLDWFGLRSPGRRRGRCAPGLPKVWGWRNRRAIFRYNL